MAEMAHPGENHRQPGGVGSGDDLVVADRSARLNDRRRPTSTAASKPSANGKKASEATAEPTVRDNAQPWVAAASVALIAAIRAESRRFIWPAPMPAVTPSLA